MVGAVDFVLYNDTCGVGVYSEWELESDSVNRNGLGLKS